METTENVEHYAMKQWIGSNDKDIAVLKEQMHSVKSTIERYEINHFPTIERRFDKIENKMAYWSGIIIVIGAIIQFIIQLAT